MKSTFATILIAISTLFTGISASFNAHAANDASALSAASTLPLAYVVSGASEAGRAVVVIPAALSASAATLVVKTVEVTARGSVCLLERASDGARASVELVGHGAGAASVVAGTVLSVSVIASGVVLSTAGEAIAFIPNEIGRALMHNQRVTP